MPSAELSFQVLACVQRLSSLACAVVDSHALRRALSFQVLACVQRLSSLACVVVDSHALRRALPFQVLVRVQRLSNLACGCGFPCPPYSLACVSLLSLAQFCSLCPSAEPFFSTSLSLSPSSISGLSPPCSSPVEFPDPSAFEHSLTPGWTWFFPPIIPDSSDVLFTEPMSSYGTASVVVFPFPLAKPSPSSLPTSS
jgi:hypothetical protein